MPAKTFQAHVHALGENHPDPESGLRFCYGRDQNTLSGVFLPWAQVAARARGLGRLLLEQGVHGRDIVAVHSHDQQTALIAMLACMHIGAVPCAVAPVAMGTSERLVDQFHNILAVAGPRLVIADKALPTELLAGRALPPPVLVVDAWSSAEDCPVAATLDQDEPCFLQFTSGSTSSPKGVVVTHRMLLSNIIAISAAISWQPTSRLVGWLPIYHDMSLVGQYLTSIHHRTRACFFPPTRFGRSPDLWMQLMAQERATFSGGPNFSFAMVNRHAERRPPHDIDLSCVRGIICGSEPISAEVMREFHRLHAHLGMRDVVMPAFGMAECTLMATSAPALTPVASITVDRQILERQGEVRTATTTAPVELVACGAPAGDMAVTIRSDGAALGENRVGEIWLSGSSVFPEYYRNPDASAAALALADGRRWLRTGDLGFLRDQQLYICGRMKDVIIHNGVNYFPADVEQAVERRLPDDARLAAVVDLRRAINDDFIGLGVLFEEAARDGISADKEQRVAQFVKDYTGLPVAIAMALKNDHIPRTTSGKLIRHMVRDQLRQALQAAGSPERATQYSPGQRPG
jgi:acyl-CoA synthetase (AMP-forming)/AMP-acid ligase II